MDLRPRITAGLPLSENTTIKHQKQCFNMQNKCLKYMILINKTGGASHKILTAVSNFRIKKENGGSYFLSTNKLLTDF